MQNFGNYLVSLRAKKADAIKEYYRYTFNRSYSSLKSIEVGLMDLNEVEALYKELNLPKIDVANY